VSLKSAGRKRAALNVICEAEHMPFRHEDTSAFGPDDLKTLHEVFERVWERLRAEGYDKDEKRREEARLLLATCIMTYAKPRQLDVEMLFERCLGAFHQH